MKSIVSRLVLTAFWGGVSGNVLAADMIMQPPPAQTDWNGFYAGVYAGYARLSSSGTVTIDEDVRYVAPADDVGGDTVNQSAIEAADGDGDTDSLSTLNSITPFAISDIVLNANGGSAGAELGVLAGYNFVPDDGQLLLGLEGRIGVGNGRNVIDNWSNTFGNEYFQQGGADFSGDLIGVEGTERAELAIVRTYSAELVGRVGLLTEPRDFNFYAFGGIGMSSARLEVEYTASAELETDTESGAQILTQTIRGSAQNQLATGVAGIGVDWAASENMFLRLEYSARYTPAGTVTMNVTRGTTNATGGDASGLVGTPGATTAEVQFPSLLDHKVNLAVLFPLN